MLLMPPPQLVTNCRGLSSVQSCGVTNSMTVVSLPISCATKSVRRPNCAPRLKLWVSNSAPSHRPDEFLRLLPYDWNGAPSGLLHEHPFWGILPPAAIH